jgi:glycosyltransferase involved in cell wall biosynthesis
MTEPLVSICIPSYKAEATIKEAIQSALAQTYRNIEVNVVDNCSPDNTVEVVRAIDDSRVSVSVNDQNYGPVENWNRAVAGTKGQYVKLLCADDAIDATCIARQVTILEAPENRSAVMAAARRTVVDDNGKLVMKARGLAGMTGLVSGKDAIRKTVRSGTNPMGEPAASLIRGDVIRECLPWSGEFPYMIDVEMWTRILERGDLYAIPESLATFRVATGSWSREVVGKQRDQAVSMIKALHARRPDIISESDVRVGSARAAMMSQGRRLTYWWIDRRKPELQTSSN